MAYLGIFTPKIHGYNMDCASTAKKAVSLPNYNKYADINDRKALFCLDSQSPQKKLTGSVFEKNAPVQRRIFLIAEDGQTSNGHPFIIDSLTSDPITGIFSTKLGNYTDKLMVVCMDAKFETKLVNAINATQTVIQITERSPLNLNNLMLMINNEIVEVVNGGDTTNLVVERGKKGTVAINHNSGSVVSKIDLESKVFSKVVGFD